MHGSREDHILARNIEYLGSGDRPDFESGAFFSQMESTQDARFEHGGCARCIYRDAGMGVGEASHGSLDQPSSDTGATRLGGFYFAKGGLDRDRFFG